YSGSHVPGRYGVATEVGLLVLSLPGWLILAKLYGLYDAEERADHSTADEVFAVFNMLVVGGVAFFTAACLLPRPPDVPLVKVLTFLAVAVPSVVVARSAARAVCRRSACYTQNTLIVGAGHVGQRVAAKLLNHPEYGVNVLGFVDGRPRKQQGAVA